MAEVRGKLPPDEAVKAVYRRTKRQLRQTRGTREAQDLRARLEFLERIYLF